MKRADFLKALGFGAFFGRLLPFVNSPEPAVSAEKRGLVSNGHSQALPFAETATTTTVTTASSGTVWVHIPRTGQSGYYTETY